MCSACSNGKSQSQAAALSWGRAAPVCYSISHSALILWNVNHPSHQNAGSHISTKTWLDKICVSCWSLSSRSTREPTVVNLLKVIRFFFDETSLMKWDNYSDQAVAIQRNWIFVIRLWWIMHVSLSWLLSITTLHGSFIPLFVPTAAHRGFNKDFGKKAPSAMPSTPGGSSKVVPIASLNPYQSKWVCFPVSGRGYVMLNGCVFAMFGTVMTHHCVHL